MEASMFDPPIRPPATPGRHGVTLLEVMTALAIIGILSGLAYIKYDTFQRQAELRSSAQKFFQILSWSRLESEKRGDTLLIQFDLPIMNVYRDIDADGKVDAAKDALLLTDSLARSVRLFTPAANPAPALAIAPSSGLADGAGVCGPDVCCHNLGNKGKPTWNVPTSEASGVAICARNMPRMPSVMEEGAIYLESAVDKVDEKWSIVMASSTSANPTLWASDQAPASSSDWNQRR